MAETIGQKLIKAFLSTNKGKIGLAISPMQPNVLYAAVELDKRAGSGVSI